MPAVDVTVAVNVTLAPTAALDGALRLVVVAAGVTWMVAGEALAAKFPEAA
jgi:hypothetical protein